LLPLLLTPLAAAVVVVVVVIVAAAVASVDDDDDDDQHCGAKATHTCGYNLAGPLPHVVCLCDVVNSFASVSM